MISLPLIASSPMLSKADAGLLVAIERAAQRAAHHRELQQVLGAAIHVRAQVEHLGETTAHVGQQGGDGRPVDGVEGLEHIARQGHQRAGIASRDANVGGGSSPSPALSCDIATRIDESRLRRSAPRSRHPSPTTSVARTSVQRGQPWAPAAPAPVPTSTRSACGWGVCLLWREYARHGRDDAGAATAFWEPPALPARRLAGVCPRIIIHGRTPKIPDIARQGRGRPLFQPPTEQLNDDDAAAACRFPTLLVHAERHHGDQEVCVAPVGRAEHSPRALRGDLAARSRPHGQGAWPGFGVQQGERVATLAGTAYRHMECTTPSRLRARCCTR